MRPVQVGDLHPAKSAADGGLASAALRRLGGLAGRPLLWTVLTLAVAAALLSGHFQIAQAQSANPLTIETVLTPNPIVIGGQTGAELSVIAIYDTDEPTPRLPRVISLTKVTVSVSSTPAGYTPIEGQEPPPRPNFPESSFPRQGFEFWSRP